MVNEPRTSATVYGDDLAVTETREGEAVRLSPDLNDPDYDARLRGDVVSDQAVSSHSGGEATTRMRWWTSSPFQKMSRLPRRVTLVAPPGTAAPQAPIRDRA